MLGDIHPQIAVALITTEEQVTVERDLDESWNHWVSAGAHVCGGRSARCNDLCTWSLFTTRTHAPARVAPYVRSRTVSIMVYCLLALPPGAHSYAKLLHASVILTLTTSKPSTKREYCNVYAKTFINLQYFSYGLLHIVCNCTDVFVKCENALNAEARAL